MYKTTKPKINDQQRDKVILLDDSVDYEDRSSGDAMLESVRSESLLNNEVIKAYNHCDKASIKPMAYVNIFKFFEDYFDKKSETDA